jgi:hypothetical protein
MAYRRSDSSPRRSHDAFGKLRLDRHTVIACRLTSEIIECRATAAI